MKDSGIEWLGQIPRHWGVTRLKYEVSRIVDCPHETPVYEDDGSFLVIRTANVFEGRLELSNARRVVDAEYKKRIRREALLPDDIVYGREGERWGLAALIPQAPTTCLGQRMMQFRISSDNCPHFIMWHLNSRAVYNQGSVDTVGATSPHVNVETIKNYMLTCPSKEEQENISTYINSETCKIDTLIAKSKQAIELMKERRTALISAAVTGKIDVRAEVEYKTNEAPVLMVAEKHAEYSLDKNDLQESNK